MTGIFPRIGFLVSRFLVSLVRPLLISLALTFATIGGTASAGAESTAEVQKRLSSDSGTITVASRAIDPRPLREFYHQRGFKLAWTGANASQGEHLLTDLQSNAQAEGLVPAAYAVPASASELDRDLLVSDAALRFARDVAHGRVQSMRAYGGIGEEPHTGLDTSRFLRDLAAGKSFSDAMAPLPPPYAGYQRLHKGMERTRAIAAAGGWPSVPDGPSIKPGTSDPRVPALRRRLIATGELAAQYAEGEELDAALVEALKRFQFLHGLDEDGAVGKRTLAALNVPVEERLRQIAANMERWRWLPRQMPAHHIAVNVAAATLEVVDNGSVALTMRVVVGDARHPTPPLSASMNTMVLNPAWRVPASIATKEILPKLQHDPDYLANQHLRIADFPEDSPEASGEGVDWSQYEGRFPFRLRQPPGPDNALGKMKFNLRDSDDIYLHDTPNHKVFARAYRALSHGCVRVEKPLELAELLLGDAWQGKLPDALLNKSTRTLKLQRTMPVYLLYWTAWAEDDGTMHFNEDLYGHDRRLEGILDRVRTNSAQLTTERHSGSL
jgi:murein L,D-transpeptidase YcbB/YkuD